MELIAVSLLIAICVAVLTVLYRNYIFSGFKYECFFEKDEVYEGEEAEFTEIVTNSKLLPLPWLKTELTVPKYLEFPALQSTVTDRTRFVTSFFALKSFSRVRRTWKVKFNKRGHYSIERISVISSDILGLIKSSAFVDMSALKRIDITVLPVCTDYETDTENKSQLSGDIFTKAKLISDPFYINGVREYTVNDSFRSINWYATAKEQQLMVNKNDFTSNCSVTVILNVQSTVSDSAEVIFKDNVERCIKICAAVIRDCCELGIPVRLLSNAEINGSPVDVLSANSTELYRTLAFLEFNIHMIFEKYLSRILPLISDSEIIIVSPYHDECFEIFAQEYPDIDLVIPEMHGGEI